MADYLPMSLPETEDLADLERIVERGLNTFAEVGCALLSIRDRRLYRGTHKTFEEYCLARWSFTKTHANRLIAAHGVVAGLAPTGVKPPENERQARALAGMDPDDAAEVLEEARETAEEEEREVTAKDIEDIAREAGIDPKKLNRPPDLRAKAIGAIRASVRGIRAKVSHLDAGEQEQVEQGLACFPDCLTEEDA